MQGGNAQNKKRFIIVSLILILSLALPCFATVTEFSGDGYSFYSFLFAEDIFNLSLPEELDPVISSYPYCFIATPVDAPSEYGLVFSRVPAYVRSVTQGGTTFYVLTFKVDTDVAIYFYSTDTHSFDFVAENSFGAEANFGFYGFSLDDLLVWSNHAILDYSSNSVLFNPPSAVSTDGYTVLSWDGDTSGLPVYQDNFYRVSDFFSVTNDRVYSNFVLFGKHEFPLLMTSQGDPWSVNIGPSPIIYGFNSGSPGVYFYHSVDDQEPSYPQLFAYRESETEGPTGAVTGLNIITPPLGETDYIVYAGTQLQCTAQVTGTGGFNSAVTWSLSYSPSTDYYPTISETGLLRVHRGVPEQRIFITATSVADPSIYATVPVYIMPPAVSSVTITPSSATAVPGQNVQFSATVSGSNVEDSAVTWAVGGASSASTRITRDGLLLIGSDEVSPVIAVRATSDQDGSVYGTALVTINVPAAVTGVTITPDDIVLNRGDVQQFTATVTGTGSYDNSVTWQITSVYSAGTSISNSGLLTIGEEQKYDYIIIKATSTADPSLSATAYVFVEDAISDPMNIDLSVLERLLEEIKNYLKTLQHIFDRPHYFREFNMYTGKLNEQEEQITGLTFNFYRFMQNMEEYVGSIAYTFANGAEVQIREDTTEGFDWFSLFFGKDSGSKVEKSDFAGISTIVTNTRDLFDTGFGFSDFFELIGSVPFFTDEVGSQLDTTTRQFDVRDPDPFNMSVLGNRDEQLEEWRNKHTD